MKTNYFFSVLVIISLQICVVGQRDYDPWSTEKLAERQMDQAILQQRETVYDAISNGQRYVNAYQDMVLMQSIGKLKTSKGQATTKITASGQNSLVEAMARGQKSLPSQEQVRQTASAALTAFNNYLKFKKLAPYDAADGRALAFVLAYQMYNNEDPGAARLIKLRNVHRDLLLKDMYFQGKENTQKQKEYEDMAIRTMYGWRAYQLSKQLDLNSPEKEKAKQTSQTFAYKILDDLWNSPVSGIQLSTNYMGFEDRGKAVLGTGQAVNTFNRNKTLLTASQYVSKYKKSETFFVSLLEEFDREVTARGGEISDAAWVNTIAFAFMYETYTQKKVRLNDKQLNWVFNEMSKDMLSSQWYQGLANADKQKYYEEVALDSMIIYDNYRQIEKQARGMERAMLLDEESKNARRRLATIFDPKVLSDYRLTQTGFTKIN